MSEPINFLPATGFANPTDLLAVYRNGRTFSVPVSAVSGIATTLGYYNVKDFGAKGDGVTDDTAAIQAAATACAQAGGTVFLPVGNYIISTTIMLSSNTWMRGDSQFSTILTCSTNFAGQPVKAGFPQDPSFSLIANSQIANTSAAPVQQNIWVSDLQLNGRADVLNATGFNNSGAALFFRQVANVVVERVRVYNTPTTGFQIDGWNSSSNWPVDTNLNVRLSDNCLNLSYNPYGPPPVYTPDGSGGLIVPIVILIRGANNVLVDGNVIGDMLHNSGSVHTNDALDVVGSSHVVIVHNKIFQCGDGIGFNTGNYANIANNLIDGAGGVGIALYGSDGPPNLGTGQIYVTIANNVITNLGINTAFSTSPGKTGILLGSNNQPNANASYQIACVNNTMHWAVTATGPAGIDIESNHTIVMGNIIDMGNCPNVLKGVRVNTGTGGGNNLIISHNQVWNGYTGSVAYQIDYNNFNNATNVQFDHNQSQGVPTKFLNGGGGALVSAVIRDNDWNPLGLIVPPSGSGTGPQNLPASGTVLTNASAYDVMITTSGSGAITGVSVGGQATGMTSTAGNSQTIFVQSGETIAVTYTGTIQWTWFAT